MVGLSPPLSHAQLAASETDAARRASGDYVVTERGPHHRVWSRVSYETNRQGRVWARTNAYTELATGMHYRNERGEWTESVPGFELEPGWAVARRGAHQVSLAADARTYGGVDIRTPDNQRLRSHVLGLSYLDTSSGQAVLIAETTNCVGQLLPSGNEVLYANAFTDFRADLLYTCTKAGIRQDVILREQPPAPELFGLNPQTTRLQVLTEFVEAPEPVKQTLGGESTSTNRPAMEVEPADTILDFGTMQMGRGLAFLAGEATRRRAATPVSKRWVAMEGRRCLVEEVRWPAMSLRLRALPQAAAYRGGANDTNLLVHRCVPWERLLPAGPETRKSTGMLAWAAAAPATPGYVVDYELYGSLADFTLRGDTTYHVTDTVYLTGCVTLEGGTVVKSETSDCGSVVFYSNNIRCQTGPYRPAVFTSVNDDTIGMTINGSTGNPSSADVAEAIVYWASTGDLHDIQVRYAQMAINALSNPFRATHLRISHCFNGIAVGGTVYLGNVLFYHIEDTAVYFADPNSVVVAEHLTARNPSGTVPLWWGEDLCNEEFEPRFTLRNSLLCGFTVNCGADLHFTESVAANAFHQTVGAGAHYLAEESIYRDAGTADIDATLRAELRKKTTWPPLVFSNATVATDTTLLPQAQRDTDAPDLGYHYDPVDYIPTHLAVTNCTLSIRQGTVLAYYDATGLWLQSGGAMDCEGTPLTPNRFVDYRTVQEQPVKLGPSPVGSGMPLNPARLTGGTPAPARLRFTQFSRMGRGSYSGYDLYAVSTWSFSSLDVRDCVFQGGNVMLYSDASSGVGPVTLVNNVFERQAFGLIGEPTLSLYNNLFKECPHVSFDVWGGTSVLRDNVFDSILLDDWFDPPQTHSHNAYVNVKDFYGNPARLYPPQATDQVLTNFLYATGPLGDYYQVSTNLLNTGSRTADLAGLYHHTVLTNWVNGAQIKETNSVVDTGFHYVAVTEAGTPVDTDGDGLPDYFEDTNGNGAYDSSVDLGNFTSEDTDGDGLPDGWEWLHFGSFAPDDQSDYDGDGRSDLEEYLTGTDPNTIAFRVAVTNNFVSTAVTTVQIAISGGMPFAQAVLVDNTNFSGATWSSCLSTNVLVNLGTTEGWREVWIGLRGRQTTSEQTWQRKWLKLDSSPPPLIFTSPSTNTVSQPMLQLQGYCTEALSRLSCDVSNAAGVFTNQMILVLDQHYDRTARGFTTNTFQAFDLELTNGLNTLTVQAVDLAGNTATTNLSFMLVSDTNAPVVQLYWPQDGVRLSGDSFTWRGWVDDFTATVTATIADGGGTTNELNVLVERDGHFGLRICRWARARIG